MATVDPIGEFNKRVTFQYYPTTADGAGGQDETTPTVILETFARVRDRGTSRSISEFVDTVFKRKEISVFYREELYEDLNKTSHILYNGNEYAIEGKTLVERVIKFDVTGSE